MPRKRDLDAVVSGFTHTLRMAAAVPPSTARSAYLGTMGMARTVAQCPVCGETRKLTEEHAIPQWLLRDLDRQAGDQPKKRYREEAPITYICSECNAWSNTTFERAVMPVLRRISEGKPHVFSRRQQMKLAGWITKTMIMLNGVPRLPGELKHNSAEQRFRKAGRPFPHTRIFVGRWGEAALLPPDFDQVAEPENVVWAIRDVRGSPGAILARGGLSWIITFSFDGS